MQSLKDDFVAKKITPAFWTFTLPNADTQARLQLFIQRDKTIKSGVIVKEHAKSGDNPHFHLVLFHLGRPDNTRPKILKAIFPGEKIAKARVDSRVLLHWEAVLYYLGYYMLKERSEVDYDYLSATLPSATEFKDLYLKDEEHIKLFMESLSTKTQSRSIKGDVYEQFKDKLEEYELPLSLESFTHLMQRMMRSRDPASHFVNKRRIIAESIQMELGDPQYMARSVERLVSFELMTEDEKRTRAHRIFMENQNLNPNLIEPDLISLVHIQHGIQEACAEEETTEA